MAMNESPFKRLLSDRMAVSGIIIIVFLLVISILGPLIRLDKSPKANKQFLELARKHPGFTTSVLYIPKSKASDQNPLHMWIYGKDAEFYEVPIKGHRVLNDTLYVEPWNSLDPTIVKGEIAYPLSLWNDPTESEMIGVRKHLLGTDRYGRDLLSRLMSGTWISFTVGLISIVISLVIGLSIGMVGGYFSGRVDDFVVWLINVVWSIPTLLLVIAITMALGKGFWQVFVAVGLTMWVEVARIVRGQVLSVKQKEFVEAGKAFGFSHLRILFKHVLPNITGPLIVISASNFAAAILIEAGLSFLGLGAQPPQATWGRMISEHKGYIITGDAYLAIFPGIAICLLVLSFVLLGNGLRDVFDIKGNSSNQL